ncbi:MAG TPA: shikimate dehydrogenase [Candidatus Polarisedimenticolia bacterium]|nr:shikimate dehydrogenase [Candidatus Polarisedimenticolia bacterium]
MAARSLVIEVVACDTTEQMRRAYLAADARADIVELRFDQVRDLRPERLLDLRGKPKLVTMRSRQQGGGARPSDREPVLRKALAAGVEYLDLEFGSRDHLFLKGPGRARRILSHHDFQGTPADLQALHGEMRQAGEDALLKIVTFADSAGDILRMRDLLRSAKPGTLTGFCMGPKGIASRILAPLWGSAAIYAPRRGAAESAPGQIALEDLFETHHFHRISSSTRILGVLGSPVGHSLSPSVHNAALRALDLDYCYLPFEATTVAEFLPVLSEMRLKGLSVTLPHKVAVLPHLDRLDETARRVGAVNTVVKVWNRLEGFNTDVAAAVAPLKRRMSLRGARVAVMGAGGAARALVHGLAQEQAQVTIFNRTAGRARALAREVGARSLPWERLRRFACDLLVNATSVGLAPDIDRAPVPIAWIDSPRVYDIIYNPPETRLIREARARGREVMGGLEMFVEQAAAQFVLFTGKDAPTDVMREAALRALGLRARPVEAVPGPGRAARRGQALSGPVRPSSHPGSRRRARHGARRKARRRGAARRD